MYSADERGRRGGYDAVRRVLGWTAQASQMIGEDDVLKS